MTRISLFLYIYYVSQCRIDSEIFSKELTAQKLHEMSLQNKNLSSKLDSLEPHSASIRQFREDRFKADTRVELAERRPSYSVAAAIGHIVARLRGSSKRTRHRERGVVCIVETVR